MYFFVVRLHAQEDGVGSEAGEAALQVRLPSQLLRLGVQIIQRLDRLLKLLLVNLWELHMNPLYSCGIG